MQRSTITQRLRDYWKEDNMKEFNKLFALSKWMIPKKDKENIEKALAMKGCNDPAERKARQTVLEVFPGSKFIGD